MISKQIALFGLIFILLVPSASYGQPQSAIPCKDEFTGTGIPERQHLKILLGKNSEGTEELSILQLKQLLDCEIETYEAFDCTLRYTTGQFWDPQNAQPLLLYVQENGFPDAKLFAFAYDHVRIVGWGQRVDFGDRIE